MARTPSEPCLFSIFAQKNMEKEERTALCALNRLFGFEPRLGLALIKEFGGGMELFSAPKKEVRDVLGAYSRMKYLDSLTESAYESAAMELEKLSKDGCRFIGYGEKGYPALLEECEDPPIGLYFKGVSMPEDVFGGRPAVSVVGTRDITSYGREWCHRIVGSMSRAAVRPLIVSGLAIGVDSNAHRAALDSGLPTVAVMATGIDSIYPACNRELGERIASTPGCALVTDYPPGTDAVRINFLRRNRIIAGIGRATVLVESKIRGGGMMTARLAASYGRDLFVLPGRVDDPFSQGCNLLARENLAECIGDLGEFTTRLGLGRASLKGCDSPEESVETFYKGKVSDTDLHDLVRVAKMIKKNRGISLDDICAELGWTFSTTSRLTTMLECDGFIEVDLLQHCCMTHK